MLLSAFVLDMSKSALQSYVFFSTFPNFSALFSSQNHSCILNSRGVMPVRRLKYLLKKEGLGKSRSSEI